MTKRFRKIARACIERMDFAAVTGFQTYIPHFSDLISRDLTGFS